MIVDVSKARAKLGTKIVRFAADERGTTAIEFAMIALPFFTIIFAIISNGLVFFIYSSIERGVWEASRDLRTGLLQLQLQGYAGNPADLKDKFKQKLCSRMPEMIKNDCDANMRVIVQSYGTNYGSITTPSCTATSGNTTTLTPQATTAFDAGSDNDIVMVTGCYKWDFAKNLPIVKMNSGLSDGSFVFMSSATFRNEPFR
jgi:Flp pilus assembly protein TadG